MQHLQKQCAPEVVVVVGVDLIDAVLVVGSDLPMISQILVRSSHIVLSSLHALHV